MEKRPRTRGRLDEGELEALAAGVSPVGEVGWRHQPGPLDVFVLRGNDETVHLYAAPERGQAILDALESAREDIPRLVAEVRRLRTELEEERQKKRPEPVPAVPALRRPAGDVEIAEDALVSLAAPFRVGPREMKAAKDDPLVALAVQVAKALQPDAKDIERARLIAMAFAAARGDTTGFWASRQQRATKASAANKKK